MRWLDEARELLSRLTDPGKRQIVRQRLARLLQVEERSLTDGRRVPASPRPPGPPRPPVEPAAEEPKANPFALALLELILVHPETAGPVLESMADYWPQDQSRLLFDRLQAAFKARGEPGLADAIGDDLPPPLASLVARAALEPRTFPSGQADGAARHHQRRLLEIWGRRRQAELSEGIARAQAAGDEAGARHLAEEKKEVAARVRAFKKMSLNNEIVVK